MLPFWGNERFKRSGVYLILFGVASLRILAAYLFLAFLPQGRTWVYYFYFLYTPLMLGAFYWCFKIHIIKLLYTMLLLQLLSTFVNYIASIAVTPFYLESDYIAAEPGYIIATALLLALFLPFIFRLFKGLLRYAFSVLSNKSILMLCIMPLLFFGLINVYASVIQGVTELSRISKSVINLCIIVTGIASSYINIRMVLDAAKNIQTEKQLIAEKVLLESLNRTKSEFFSNINHEMKTPLTIIATDIQLAENLADSGSLEAAKSLMQEAWWETMRLANQVNDTLIFSRDHEVSRPMELFDFSKVIEDALAVFEPLIKKQGNTLEKDIAKLPPIKGNADMLAGALVNLLSNANRHTEDGVISIQWAMVNGQNQLSLADNGSGITPEILPRVFERGVSSGNGTGLGLNMVKTVMDLHGAEVAIQSEVGRGTQVTLRFPALLEV
jgi:signal transduction histidine kinase